MRIERERERTFKTAKYVPREKNGERKRNSSTFRCITARIKSRALGQKREAQFSTDLWGRTRSGGWKQRQQSRCGRATGKKSFSYSGAACEGGETAGEKGFSRNPRARARASDTASGLHFSLTVAAYRDYEDEERKRKRDGAEERGRTRNNINLKLGR